MRPANAMRSGSQNASDSSTAGLGPSPRASSSSESVSYRPCSVLLDVLAPREAQRQERAHQLEALGAQRLGHLGALAEVAGRPEFAADVAELGHRPREHRARRQVVAPCGQLEDAEADGCARDADAHRARPTSGTRGSGSSDCQASRTHARSGSSEAAIERTSPASAFR